MSEHFADRLLTAIEKKGSPICVGIDPMLEMFPPQLTPAPANSNDSAICVDAIFEFTTRILRIVAEHVPIVKFQSAYFEKYRGDGVEAYYSLIQEAKQLGLLVIGDVKRGDIGSTSAAYAEAHLGAVQGEADDEADTPDAITVNPFCGLDTIEPFVQTARDENKGLFVLRANKQSRLGGGFRTRSSSMGEPIAKCSRNRSIRSRKASSARPGTAASARSLGQRKPTRWPASVSACRSRFSYCPATAPRAPPAK